MLDTAPQVEMENMTLPRFFSQPSEQRYQANRMVIQPPFVLELDLSGTQAKESIQHTRNIKRMLLASAEFHITLY